MHGPPQALIEWASLLASIATFVGVPIALLVLNRDRRRDRVQRELATYTQLSLAYGEHLKLCFERPQLDTVECDLPILESDHHKRDQDLFLFTVINMLEAAFFLYRDADTEFRRKQWDGWDGYMRLWCGHPEFRTRWPVLVDLFDSDFAHHMKKLYAEVTTELASSRAAQVARGSGSIVAGTS